MVILSKSVFVHVPRTGGMWLRSSLRQAGVPLLELPGDRLGHLPLREAPLCCRQLPSFTFVRNPITWVKSRWAHAVKYNAKADNRFLGIHRQFDECVESNLEDTLLHILRDQPGIVSHTFREMSEGVTWILKTENLPHNICQLLEHLGEIDSKQNQIIQSCSPINSVSHGAVITFSTLETFIESEKMAFDLWSNAI